MAEHIIQPRTYVLVFAGLILLTGLTVAVSFIDLGAMHGVVGLTIATVKAVLVILIFMHVYYSSQLTWAVALSSLLWLGILIILTLTDYYSRNWQLIPGQ